MRLHKHDEIVEAMRDAIIKNSNGINHTIVAAAALDALLKAAVKLGVAERLGEVADDPDKFSIGPLWTLADDDSPSSALILRMEASDDNA